MDAELVSKDGDTQKYAVNTDTIAAWVISEDTTDELSKIEEEIKKFKADNPNARVKIALSYI